MDSIDFIFYIKENEKFNEIITKWLKLIKFINPKEIYFAMPHKGYSNSFNEEMITKILKEDLTHYENYLLEIKADEYQYINIYLAPYLKEVAKITCRFNKENYEKHKEEILKIIDEAILRDEMMLGYGHAAIYNRFFERGYGHMEFGAYWMMWFGKWSLKYIDEQRINSIKENTIEMNLGNKYIKAKLSENPWDYNNKEIFCKKQRRFMKKLKFADIIALYNNEREFTEIELEEEDPLLEEDNSPCSYED